MVVEKIQLLNTASSMRMTKHLHRETPWRKPSLREYPGH
jgi:hypothetical protein